MGGICPAAALGRARLRGGRSDSFLWARGEELEEQVESVTVSPELRRQRREAVSEGDAAQQGGVESTLQVEHLDGLTGPLTCSLGT